jgi:hypothetical protein
MYCIGRVLFGLIVGVIYRVQSYERVYVWHVCMCACMVFPSPCLCFVCLMHELCFVQEDWLETSPAMLQLWHQVCATHTIHHQAYDPVSLKGCLLLLPIWPRCCVVDVMGPVLQHRVYAHRQVGDAHLSLNPVMFLGYEYPGMLLGSE